MTKQEIVTTYMNAMQAALPADVDRSCLFEALNGMLLVCSLEGEANGSPITLTIGTAIRLIGATLAIGKQISVGLPNGVIAKYDPDTKNLTVFRKDDGLSICEVMEARMAVDSIHGVTVASTEHFDANLETGETMRGWSFYLGK